MSSISSSNEASDSTIFLVEQKKAEAWKKAWEESKPKVRWHGLVLVGTTVALALTAAIGPSLPDDNAKWFAIQVLAGCLVCPALIGFGFRHGYLLGRALHYPVKEARLMSEIWKLPEPPRVKKAKEFSGVAKIDSAQKARWKDSPDAQGQFRASAIAIYLVPAIATLLAAAYKSLWPERPFGGGLILGQIVLLGFVILRVIVDRRPTADWVQARTRTELLRREQYLCLASVGPYDSSQSLDNMADQRIDQIVTVNDDVLRELIPMESRDRIAWYQNVDVGRYGTISLTDLTDRMSTYSYYRLWKQIAWMRASKVNSEETGRWLERGLMVTAFVNAAAVAATFSVLVMKHLPQSGSSWAAVPFAESVDMLGLFLPAFGGAWLALQSVLGLRMLAVNYQSMEERLTRFRTALEELIQQAKAESSEAGVRKFQARFQHLVLRVEAELTEELLRWRMIVQRDAHEI